MGDRRGSASVGAGAVRTPAAVQVTFEAARTGCTVAPLSH